MPSLKGANHEEPAALRNDPAVGYEIEEGLVDTGVVGEFGVECDGHRSSLPDGHGVGAFGGEDFDAFSDVRNLRSTDEDHFQRRLGKLAVEIAKKFPFADGAVELPSISIAPDADIEGAETGLRGILHFFGKKDCAGARTESGLKPNEMLEFFESDLTEKLEEGAGFSSRNHQAVDGLELFWLPDEHDFGAQLFEPPAVGVKISLQSEDSDLQSQSLSPGSRQSSTQELLHFNGCAADTCILRATRGRLLICEGASRYAMAGAKQRAAAKQNIKKAAAAAKRKRTIAHLPKKTRAALGKQAA
jgi:hypothetical protein